MKDTILLNKMWKEVSAGRVNASQCGTLTLFKYTQETHVKDLWNDVNRQARGIIFNIDGRIVARPFNKFFNLNERFETEAKNLPWSEGVEVFEKVDGSCGTGYHSWNGQWKLATPGSMESDQAIKGTRMLNEKTGSRESWEPVYDTSYLPITCTPIFEIIYPENRIVVDYHGKSELVLLAIFEHNGEEWHPRRVDQIGELCGFRRPKRYDIDLRGEIPFEDNHEGYVCRFGNGFRMKVKSPAYLRIHRLLDHLSPKRIVELIRGKEYRVVIEQLPIEIAKDFDDIRAHVQTLFNDILTSSYENLRKLKDELGDNASRKEYAKWIIKHVVNVEAGFVFALLDDKDIEDKAWKLVLERIAE